MVRNKRTANYAITLLMLLALSGCFLSNEKMTAQIQIENTQKIISSFNGGKYSYGDIIEIPLVTKEKIEGASFDVILDKRKFQLVNVEKKGVSAEHILLSYQKDSGYKVALYDFNGNVAENTEVIKMYIKVKGTGSGTIIIKNIKNKKI